jgi:hypothetical protein
LFSEAQDPGGNEFSRNIQAGQPEYTDILVGRRHSRGVSCLLRCRFCS